jgi:hypothetical protein
MSMIILFICGKLPQTHQDDGIKKILSKLVKNGSMEEQKEKIIVLDSFDSVVMANLVKTKLDAYGIPCFLSNENFTALYPIANNIFPGVRVHIFERDLVRAREVLNEEAA